MPDPRSSLAETAEVPHTLPDSEGLILSPVSQGLPTHGMQATISGKGQLIIH